MFLFNKRTRNIIKYMWAFFAILIILTMIIAYSGFASLAQAPQQQIDIPPEVQAQLDMQRQGIDAGDTVSTPEEQEILKAIEEGKIDIGSDDIDSNTVPEEGESQETPPPQTQELKLEI